MAGEDETYTRWIRTQPCAALGPTDPCGPGKQAHHAGRERGTGQRAHDHTAIPLCPRHHDAWHQARVPFRDMTRQERRDWADAAILRHRDRYTARALPEWA